MGNKYDMRICKCGRIHMIERERIEKSITDNKDLLLVCGGCGTATLIGADIEPNWSDPEKDCYTMYSNNFSKDRFITNSDFCDAEDHKAISEIFYSQGIRVPMMTGQYATDYYDGKFSDRWYPDFYKIQRKGITVDEIMLFINEYTQNRTTVNMTTFIRNTPDEMLKEISQYYIKGFNWRGTKYENKLNC